MCYILFMYTQIQTFIPLHLMSSSILFPTNQYTTSSKSSQEIQKLMIPEQTPQQTISYILNKGHPLQLPFAYRNFHNYYKSFLGLICAKIDKEEVENQVIIAESLQSLMNEQQNQLSDLELSMIFNATLDALKNWNTINNQPLVQVIEAVIKIQPERAHFLKQIEKTVLEMGKPSEPIISKVIAGRLIAVVVKYLGRSIKGEMIDIIKRIITGSEAEAKKIWVNEIFPKLLENLDIQFIQLHLQEKVYETVYDENQQIGLMALEVILRNTTKFTIEEQSSRIVRLFIDSMTSKNQKISLMATSFMGETYEKLQNIILKSEQNSMRFWKSLIEVAQSKNQRIINNLIYNLPGILKISQKFYKVDAVCEVYIELFCNPDSDTLLLVSYFHEMVKMFPTKYRLLRQTIYALFGQIFEEQEPSQDSIKIIDCIICNLGESKKAFFEEVQQKNEEKELVNVQKLMNEGKPSYFDSVFNDYLNKYFQLCNQKKNGNYLLNFYSSVKKCTDHFSPVFTEQVLLPKFYTSIKNKTAFLDMVVEIFIIFLARQVSSSVLINNYASKCNVDLSKSGKSHEREASMLFFYYSSFYFSIETFQEFKMGEKFLQFNNEKSLKNKLLFIKYLPRMVYFLTREEKIQHQIILNRLRKDPEQEVIRMIDETDFSENEMKKQEIISKSKMIKQKQKVRGASKKLLLPRRQTKDLNKEEILKKRMEPRSRNKIIPTKQVPKRKTLMSIPRVANRKHS